MGQNSSRYHSPSPSSPHVPSAPLDRDDNSPTEVSANSIHSDPTVLNISPSGGSRRSSVRKNILNLVRPSTRNRVDSATSSRRKSWRNPRRWSKAPTDLIQTAGPSSEGTGPSANIDKEKEGENNSASDCVEQYIGASDRPSTPYAPTLTEPPSDFLETTPRGDYEPSQSTGTRLSTQDAQESSTPESANEVTISHDHLINPSPGVGTTTTQTQTEIGSNPHFNPDAPEIQPSTDRQFPPPGTLVVVQGVVHTTDVPRIPPSTSNLEIPDPERHTSLPSPNSTASTRNRLSALLRSRPASTINPHPVPSDDPSTLPSTPTITSEALPPLVNPRLHPDPSIHSLSHSDIPDRPIQPTDTPQLRDSEPRNGTISSSSIDVLGTLLSVATAATAASLLTGSSEPILSPSFSPPYGNSEPAPNHSNPTSSADPWTPASTSRTPTAGLGLGDTIAAGRAARLRHAWGGIRERLGLRPTPQESDTSNSDPESSTLMSTDPRELMLAQMARAFNLGFGLAGERSTPFDRSEPVNGAATIDESGSNGPIAEGRVDSQASPQPPPEGSFERFLVDLQVDLRVALTSSNGLASSPGINTGQQPPISESEPRNLTTVSDTPLNPTHEAPDNELPELESVSDSDSEFGDNHSMHTMEGLPGSYPSEARPSHITHPIESPPAAEDNNSNLPSSGIDQDRAVNGSQSQVGDMGRINWWRLYRFPPIIAPRAHSAAGIATTEPNAPFPPGSAASLPDSGTTPPLVMDPTLSELPFAHMPEADIQTQQTHTVIPVIVVGLQSVNSAWQQRGEAEENDGLDLFGDSGDPDSGDEEINTDETSNLDTNRRGADESGRNTAFRGRAWHSRAADAIRNLRHGRRNRATQTTNLPGSRTFLIYVIGGYYPPNHSIVTGGPNSLDSFEALLELAELLGQVKPPTVTKEDIEKSGLEIIKSTHIGQYEVDGKISSNCIDRCLICLDDYQPEEDVRIMSCRHAFHKTCVDKWLETGRNNCPACRSKGVSVSQTDI